jgi:ketosteroid isomerase-like protein
MRRLSPISSVILFIVSAVIVRPALAAGTGEKAVLSALDDLKEAMLKRDRAALEKVLHPELTYGHSSATLETKAQAIAHIVDGLGWEAIELADTAVRLQGNVAIVNGKADLHQRNKDKPTTVAKLLVLTVWVKGPQGWQLIARQAVRRPDDAQVIAAQAALAAAPATKPSASAPSASAPSASARSAPPK